MTVSNEPGYYADGRFGIRIENIVLVKEVKTPNNFGDKGYLGFENVTMSVSRGQELIFCGTDIFSQVSHPQKTCRHRALDSTGKEMAE